MEGSSVLLAAVWLEVCLSLGSQHRAQHVSVLNYAPLHANPTSGADLSGSRPVLSGYGRYVVDTDGPSRGQILGPQLMAAAA